jgi:membrane associated rhomboid family serine protease
VNPPVNWTSIKLHPVTTMVGLATAAVTIAWWTGHDISAWTMNAHALRGQPWRLVTSTLPHIDVVHLGFNLYWLWVFGTAIEQSLGWLRTVLLVLLLAAGSSAAEYAFAQGGVGLSGVGYGFFGLLWVASRRDGRFQGVLDIRTIQLFVAWFFLCIGLTFADVWHVGNVAHGAGALLGALVGAILTTQGKLRAGTIGCLVIVSSFVVWAASAGRPYVNLAGDEARELAFLGYEALLDDDNGRAAELLGQAVLARGADASMWFNLGIAYQRLGRNDEAADAYRRAAQLAPHEKQYQDAAEDLAPALEAETKSADNPDQAEVAPPDSASPQEQ